MQRKPLSMKHSPPQPPNDFVLPACVCGSLRQAGRALTHLYDQALRPAGLTAMQFQVLMTINTMERATIRDLVRIATLDQTTLTRSLALLVRRGWLRTQTLADRRLKEFRLTGEGTAILGVALPLWTEVQQRALEQLHNSDWQTTRKVLESLIRFAGDPPSSNFPDNQDPA